MRGSHWWGLWTALSLASWGVLAPTRPPLRQAQLSRSCEEEGLGVGWADWGRGGPPGWDLPGGTSWATVSQMPREGGFARLLGPRCGDGTRFRGLTRNTECTVGRFPLVLLPGLRGSGPPQCWVGFGQGGGHWRCSALHPNPWNHGSHRVHQYRLLWFNLSSGQDLGPEVDTAAA